MVHSQRDQQSPAATRRYDLVSSGEVGSVSKIACLDEHYPSIASNFVRRIRAGYGNDSGWLAHLLRTPHTKRNAERYSGGTAIQNLDADFFLRHVVWWPSTNEQTKISQQLDSVDECIRAIERTIDKRIYLRLCVRDGLFHLESNVSGWRTYQVADIGKVVGGGTPCRDRDEYWGGEVPWLTPSELTGFNGKHITSTKELITQAGLDGSSATLLPSDSLLMTTRASIGFCALSAMPIATNQGFQNVIPGNLVDPSFLLHLGRTLSREMTRRASGTTFLEISGREFGRIEVRIPDLDEQRRIASILDSIDDAIAAERARLDKYVAIRAGLAADLLSGRVRTVAE